MPSDGEYVLMLQSIGGCADFRISLAEDKFISVGSTAMREGAHWPWNSIVCTPEGMEISGGRAELKAGTAYPIKVCANAAILE